MAVETEHRVTATRSRHSRARWIWLGVGVIGIAGLLVVRTVLEDRGPADELAPAAAARGIDDDEPFGTDLGDATLLAAPALTAQATGATAVEKRAPDATEGVTEAAVSEEPRAFDATPDTSDDEADAVPADEEEPA